MTTVCHQGGHVVGVGRHERERGHRPAAAREHLDRADAERVNDGVYVVRLDRGRMIDPVVFAAAAAEAARVIGDHGAVREVRSHRTEAAGVHRLADHEQRWASVRGGQRAVDIVGDVDLGGLKHVRLRHGRVDSLRVQNSSDAEPKARQRPAKDPYAGILTCGNKGRPDRRSVTGRHPLVANVSWRCGVFQTFFTTDDLSCIDPNPSTLQSMSWPSTLSTRRMLRTLVPDLMGVGLPLTLRFLVRLPCRRQPGRCQPRP
jgi:hypothetical protein